MSDLPAVPQAQVLHILYFQKTNYYNILEMAAFPGVPDLQERKGSLFLRSDHMNYSRAILNSNW